MDQERQPHIIDDAAAIGLPQTDRNRNNKKKSGATKPSALKNASNPSSKSKPKAIAYQRKDLRYYEQDGLKIPLYEKNGKRRPHARVSSGLRNKSLNELLDTVDEYAGADKKKQFQDGGATKVAVAEWIEEVETHALGASPKSRLGAPATNDGFNNDEEDVVPNADSQHAKDKGPGQKQGKRKRDEARDPTQNAQQTAKKYKTDQANEQLAEQSHTVYIKGDAASRGNGHKMTPEAPEIPKVSFASASTEEARQNESMNAFMKDVGMHSEHPDVSTRVVHLSEQREHRILTATRNRDTKRVTLHDTGIPEGYKAASGQSSWSASALEASYLKPGRHGRHGDFDNDADRLMGRGHQVSPQDQKEHEELLSTRRQVYEKYPTFPRGDDIDPEIQEIWAKNERWYQKFTDKYPGNSVNHLWPCGCEKMRGEDDSEESEEE